MKILVIGCGFLGTKIVDILKAEHSVTATKTSGPKATLEVHFMILKPSSYSKLGSVVKNFDAFIITAAAKQKASYSQVYLSLARRLKKALEGTLGKIIIYTSSSGVYMENSGNDVYENSPLNLDESSILIEAEKTYLSLQKNHRVVVARLSGLIGEGRSMKPFYQKYLSQPLIKKAVNFVYVDDAAAFIKKALHGTYRGLFNVSSLITTSDRYFFDLFHTLPPDIVESPPHNRNKRIKSFKKII